MQKSGTTSMHRYLASVPWADRGVTKEEHFFDSPDVAMYDPHADVKAKATAKQYMNYLKAWPDAYEATRCSYSSMTCKTSGYNNVTLEISPVYITDRRAPWVMHEILPHAKVVKLLLILREPVARIVSSYIYEGRPGGGPGRSEGRRPCPP